jgi:hypothetical protein
VYLVATAQPVAFPPGDPLDVALFGVGFDYAFVVATVLVFCAALRLGWPLRAWRRRERGYGLYAPYEVVLADHCRT